MIKITTWATSTFIQADKFKGFEVSHVVCSSSFGNSSQIYPAEQMWFKPSTGQLTGWLGIARYLISLRRIVQLNSSKKLSTLWIWIATDEEAFKFECPGPWLSLLSEVADEFSFEVQHAKGF